MTVSTVQTPEINRRRLLNLTGAGLALAATGATTVREATAAPLDAPAEHPDAELFRLDKEMEASHARMLQGTAVCEALDSSGKPYNDPEILAAEDAFGVRVGDLWKIGRRIFAIPANTFEGMAIKLRAGDWLLMDEFAGDNEALVSIAADIRRLANGGVA